MTETDAFTGLTALEDYEVRAQAFYLMTGYMAPGKDMPAAMGGVDEATRRAKWEAWCEQYGKCVRATMAAMHQSLRAGSMGDNA